MQIIGFYIIRGIITQITIPETFTTLVRILFMLKKNGFKGILLLGFSDLK